MIAAHGEIVALRRRIYATFDLAYASPQDVGGIAILFVARHDAALTANALRHVEMEAVLLTRRRHRQPTDWWSSTAHFSCFEIATCSSRKECGRGLLHAFNKGKVHSAPDDAGAPVAKSDRAGGRRDIRSRVADRFELRALRGALRPSQRRIASSIAS